MRHRLVTDGVVSALEQAKQRAGDNVVGLHGATVMQQALSLGLVDEIRIHDPGPARWRHALFASLDSAISLERTRRWRPLPRRIWVSG
jgi:dihydrofolate reductase